MGVGCHGNTFLCIYAKVLIFEKFFEGTLFKKKFATTFPQCVL